MQAKMNDNFSSIGNAPRQKIQKVQAAVTNNDIKTIDLLVQYTYVWGAGDHKIIPYITVTKEAGCLLDKKPTHTIINFTGTVYKNMWERLFILLYIRLYIVHTFNCYIYRKDYVKQ